MKIMNTTLSSANALRGVFDPAASGFVGIVDNLLVLCREGNLEIDYRSPICRCWFRHGDSEEVVDVPFRKSVFRAMLARVAALCNERMPNSVSPYGGKGELCLGSDPIAIFQVQFVNTPDEQKLELSPSNPVNSIHPPGPNGTVAAPR